MGVEERPAIFLPEKGRGYVLGIAPLKGSPSDQHIFMVDRQVPAE